MFPVSVLSGVTAAEPEGAAGLGEGLTQLPHLQGWQGWGGCGPVGLGQRVKCDLRVHRRLSPYVPRMPGKAQQILFVSV